METSRPGSPGRSLWLAAKIPRGWQRIFLVNGMGYAAEVSIRQPGLVHWCKFVLIGAIGAIGASKWRQEVPIGVMDVIGVVGVQVKVGRVSW